MSNIFNIPEDLPQEELLEHLLSNSNVLIERIVSRGQVTPVGEWYDLQTDEWVILLQGRAELSYEDGNRLSLRAGDYLTIPAHQRHRVEYTSTDPVCIWLAVHITN